MRPAALRRDSISSDGTHGSACPWSRPVRAAIRLAQELGIECIAEGVETEAQDEFLVAAGCESAQGYYFGKPISAEELTQHLNRDHPPRKPTQPKPIRPRLTVVSG
ncbi:MAG TPA: EAL domain-containing protein [Xanthobacteraceae bacterium]